MFSMSSEFLTSCNVYNKVYLSDIFVSCSGMSYLAAVLLMHLDEEEAFWCFVSLLEKPKYFSGYFLHNMDRLIVL